MLPMMSDRRIVVVLRGERLLKPKRRGRGADGIGIRGGKRAAKRSRSAGRVLKQPVTSTTLVVVAADVDRTRRIGKTL